MALTFTDTYNMIVFLTKSDASEGFEKIIDFLNGSVIQYALMVNPTIYVSCIKQFWSSVSLKKTNDVRLQALIDKRKVLITEDTVRQALRLDDADSIDCLTNEEIFVELARMGLIRNVDSSSKFYMYPRFLQLMIDAQVGDLSSHATKYTSPALTQKVFANMRRVGKGFSRVDTPLFDGMLVPQQVHDDVAAIVDDADAEPTPLLPTSATTPPPQQKLIPSSSQAESTPPLLPHQSPIAQPSSPPPEQPSSHDDKIAQSIEITKLKQRVRKLEKKRELKASRLKRLRKVGTAQRVKTSVDTVMDDQEDASKQGGIAELDADEDVTLEEVLAEVAKDADVQGRLEESQAHVYHLDLEHAQKVLITAAATTITVAPMPKASAARRRKGVVIRDPKETATSSVIVHSEPKSKDKGKGILVEEPKPLKRQAQIEQDEAYDRELEAELNVNINRNEVIEQENMIVYLKNMAGFKMDFFKGMTYDEIRPIFEKHFNSIVAFLEKEERELEEEASKQSKRKSENSEEKAAKKHKLDEEVEELKTHLQIVPNDEDDVYIEATPLTLKLQRIYAKGLLLLVKDLLLLRLQYEREAALERTVKNLHEKVASLLCECNAKDNLISEHLKTAQEAIEGWEKADYRQQVSALKDEQDKRASDKLTNLTVENAQLAKALMMKEELIEDVSHQMSQASIEFNELISRLDSAEKENVILKYEYRVLERELEMRSRCADVAN
nr:hypothetical protein [Tanacetum cinerariifolium]